MTLRCMHASTENTAENVCGIFGVQTLRSAVMVRALLT